MLGLGVAAFVWVTFDCDRRGCNSRTALLSTIWLNSIAFSPKINLINNPNLHDLMVTGSALHDTLATRVKSDPSGIENAHYGDAQSDGAFHGR